MMNWLAVKDADWKTRNSAVALAIQRVLDARDAGAPALSTLELARCLAPGFDREVGTVLSKLAPYLKGYATHDGPSFIAYGKRFKRWQWRGRRDEAPEDRERRLAGGCVGTVNDGGDNEERSEA